jgi:hypothetical protein
MIYKLIMTITEYFPIAFISILCLMYFLKNFLSEVIFSHKHKNGEVVVSLKDLISKLKYFKNGDYYKINDLQILSEKGLIINNINRLIFNLQSQLMGHNTPTSTAELRSICHYFNVFENFDYNNFKSFEYIIAIELIYWLNSINNTRPIGSNSISQNLWSRILFSRVNANGHRNLIGFPNIGNTCYM